MTSSWRGGVGDGPVSDVYLYIVGTASSVTPATHCFKLLLGTINALFKVIF